MTFGHSVFDSFGADQILFAETPAVGSGGEYALIKGPLTNTGAEGKYQVWYSQGKSGAMVQTFNTKGSAISFAKKSEPTGNIIDISDGKVVDATYEAWGAFSEWANIDACTLERSRTRKQITPAFNGGAEQDIQQVQQKAKDSTEAVLSAWSDYGECSNGSKTRTRVISEPATCGGTNPDATTLTESVACTASEETSEETTDDSSTTGEGVTNITAQSTTVTPVAPSSKMNYSPFIALTLIGGVGYLYKKRKDSKSKA